MIGEFGNNFYFAREGDQPFGGGSGNIGIGNDVLGDQDTTNGSRGDNNGRQVKLEICLISGFKICL